MEQSFQHYYSLLDYVEHSCSDHPQYLLYIGLSVFLDYNMWFGLVLRVRGSISRFFGGGCGNVFLWLLKEINKFRELLFPPMAFSRDI